MTTSKNDTTSIKQLIRELRGTLPVISTALAELKANSIDLAKATTELTDVKEHVTKLSRIVMEGNGHESLLTRVTLLEKANKEKKETARFTKAQWITVIAALVTSLGSIIAVWIKK